MFSTFLTHKRSYVPFYKNMCKCYWQHQRACFGTTENLKYARPLLIAVNRNCYNLNTKQNEKNIDLGHVKRAELSSQQIVVYNVNLLYLAYFKF